MSRITYAKAGGPPTYWRGLKVFDLESGREVTKVVEVNAAEGWLLRFREDERGQMFEDPNSPGHAAQERLSGHFKIVRS